MAEGYKKTFRAVGPVLTAFFMLTLGLIPSSRKSPVEPFSLGLTQMGSKIAQATWQPEPDVTLPYLQLWSAQGFNQRYLGALTTFDSLLQLMAEINQRPVLSQPITLQFIDCDDLSIRYSSQRRELSFCYDLLVYLEDSFDDLSASPRERELAVLDAVYFLVVRQLSRIVLEEAEIPLTARSHDELTVALPLLLKSRSPGIILSGTQWIFNQGHPLGVSDALAKFQGEPLTLDTYHRLVCTAYGADAEPHPYLRFEVPHAETLATCPREAGASGAGTSGAGTLDAGQLVDAGKLDTGKLDTGISEAGTLLKQWRQRLNLEPTP